jgi:hypothetical protein
MTNAPSFALSVKPDVAFDQHDNMSMTAGRCFSSTLSVPRNVTVGEPCSTMTAPQGKQPRYVIHRSAVHMGWIFGRPHGTAKSGGNGPVQSTTAGQNMAVVTALPQHGGRRSIGDRWVAGKIDASPGTTVIWGFSAEILDTVNCCFPRP